MSKPTFVRASGLHRVFAGLCLVHAPLAQAQDLAAIGIPRPVSGAALSATETVAIRVFNFGSSIPAGSSIGVAYAIDAATPVAETVVLGSPFAANTARYIVFSATADLSTPGTYTFTATVSLPGDTNPTNDTFGPVSVKHLADALFGDGFEPR